jgi:hypothetical protein
MVNHIERHYGKDGLHAFSVHPGGVPSRAQRHGNPDELTKRIEIKHVLKTQAWAAVAKVWEGKGRKYLEDCRKGKEVEEPSFMQGLCGFCVRRDGEEEIVEDKL